MERVEIRTEDGTCPAYLFQPAGEGPHPAVLFYMDGIGIRPALFEMGERLAAAGHRGPLADPHYPARTSWRRRSRRASTWPGPAVTPAFPTSRRRASSRRSRQPASST